MDPKTQADQSLLRLTYKSVDKRLLTGAAITPKQPPHGKPIGDDSGDLHSWSSLLGLQAAPQICNSPSRNSAASLTLGRDSREMHKVDFPSHKRFV